VQSLPFLPPWLQTPCMVRPVPFDRAAEIRANRAQVKLCKALCQECPVVDECREWGIAQGELWGIWGGLTAHERAIARVSRGLPALVFPEYRLRGTAS
jgi:hypothetical protein